MDNDEDFEPHYSFPSIEQFRNVVKAVRSRRFYTGSDTNGDPIYDYTRTLPVLDFEGTVKLHGTNASIVFDVETKELTYQSRSRVLTLEHDNAGFMLHMMAKEDALQAFFAYQVAGTMEANIPDKIVLFGEWIGKGIQKGVAVSELEKQFVAFAMRWIYLDNRDQDHWQDVFPTAPSHVFRVITSFPTYHIKIDFSNPDASINEMLAITEAVEAECPVGKDLGVFGVGEGVVWRCMNLDYDSSDSSQFWFKVKGDAHVKNASLEGLHVSPADRLQVINFCIANGIKEFEYYFSE